MLRKKTLNSQAMKKITVLGSSNIDMTAFVDHLPDPGETVGNGRYALDYGGKGANQAVAAARLGGEVAFVSAVGLDAQGENLLTYYKDEKMDIAGVMTIPGQPTGTALIMVDARGENFIAVCPGANDSLDTARVDSAEALISNSGVLVMQAEIPYESCLRGAQIARKAGATIIYNPAPIFAVPNEMLQLVDILVVNEEEGKKLAGFKGVHEDVAAELHRRGAANVIVTLGAKGAYCYDGTSGIFVPSFKVKAVDTVGAGDTFCGALAADYSRRSKLDREALIFASAASAIAVTRPGAQPAIPTRQEVLDFLASL